MPYIDSGFDSHPLSPNHLRSFPRDVIYLDTETRAFPHPKGQLHRFRLGWTCAVHYDLEGVTKRQQWVLHREARELCAYLVLQARSRQPLYLVGHNLYFDLQVGELFFWLPQWGWKLDFVYEHGLAFILIVSAGACRIKAISSTNFFDCSLEELGQSIGLPKGKVDFKGVNDEELAGYCRRDVEITRQAMEGYFAFNRAHDTGRFSLTRASQCLACYRHRFLDHRLDLHSFDSAVELERSAYMGGRVECFQLGEIKEGPFRFYDVNSMYPWVMRNHSYPTRLIRYYPQASLRELERFRSSACLVAEVDLASPEPAYAVRRSGKLIFPIGRFRAFLCTGAFWRAVERGHLAKVYRAAVYERSPIFRSYVDYWWPAKQRYQEEGNELYRRIVKSFLNSLYGKFGQRGHVLEELEQPAMEGSYVLENFEPASGERWIEYNFFGRCFIDREVGNARHTFVAVAAHVTEYARLALWDFISRLGARNVLYCDTDSLVVGPLGRAAADRKFRSRGLGALTVDLDCSRFVLHGPKDYSADGKRKIKGVPNEAIEERSGYYRYDSWPGLATHRREGIDQGYLVRPTRKRLLRVYDKGLVHADGKVSPLELEEF